MNDIKLLKEKTGMPLNKCKRAYELFNGDMIKSYKFLEIMNSGVCYKKIDGCPFNENDYIDLVNTINS